MDHASALTALSERAARYSINLNGQVHLDNKVEPGHGSSALVYRGVLQHERRLVAVKMFNSIIPGDLDGLKRILREAHLWSKLRHDNVIRMLGISTDFGSTISIISDWMGMGDA
ncbi:hypothetical protein ID866_9290, partial [Astraeus odoratus]